VEKEFELTITSGAENYQIFQQENGFAKITLKGNFTAKKEFLDENAKVVVHLIDEDNAGALVIPPVTAQVNGNEWSATFNAPAGGLYAIRTYLRSDVRDERTGDAVHHIGVGDIYLIAGQSNAEGHSKRGINDPVSMQVHMFGLNKKWDIASHPLSDCTGSEYKCFKDRTLVAYHTPWLQFAKIVISKVGYPIGLLPSAIGGVPLSVFDKREDGKLYDDMMEIVKNAGGKIKGVLWYQGCSDCNPQRSVTYFERFKYVCDEMRKELKFDVPIITVQLNKQTWFSDLANIPAAGENWATVREAQRKAAHEIKDVYIVPSIDLQLCDTIHNQPYSNMVIAERCAHVALKYIYGKNNPCESPDIEKAVLVESNKVKLYFNNVYDAIVTDYYSLTLPFEVKDANGKQGVISYDCAGDNTITLQFENDIVLPATIGCTKFTESGFVPYDCATRLPILCFANVEIEK